MKALIVGFGSIGQRHTRILKSMGFEIAVVTSQSDVSIPRFPSISHAVSAWQPNHVVIASPTSAHFHGLNELTGTTFGGTCVVEKPIFETSRDFSPSTQFVVGVGYNLRFLPTIQRLRELLIGEEVLTASFYNGEFLPDWRPGRDYRTTSSASRSMGGGVLRDLSHEIDFIHYLLGAPCSVLADVSQSGTLEIETDDTVRAILKHTDGCTTTLALSYLDRARRREIVLATKRRSIYCNLLTGEVLCDGELSILDVERDLTFKALHRDIATRSFSVACKMNEGLEVLRTIEMIESSSAHRIWMTR